MASAHAQVRQLGVAHALTPDQSKYVYCPNGAVLELVIEIRVGSPTFGRWDAVRFDSIDHRAVYLSEGLGHAFTALADAGLVSYLCSTGYNPSHELTIDQTRSPACAPGPDDIAPVLSRKDATAPTLADAQALSPLPGYDQRRAFYQTGRSGT